MRVLHEIDRDEIAALLERQEFFWLDLHSPSQEDVAKLGAVLSLHPLVLEDMHHGNQRPKLEDYGDYALIVFYGARAGDPAQPELVEVELVVHGDYLITTHRAESPELEALHEYFRQRPPGSEQFVVYRVLDTLTDTFFPLLSAIDDEIDDLEDAVIEAPDDEQLQQLFRLKRSLVVMRKIVTPQRDLFARAGDDIIRLPGLEAGTRDYFRDVYDHLIRISDLIDSYRDLLTGAMDVYLSTVSNRLNAVMKQLTLVATIFLPLTFITGFFGQNFGWMVEHISGLGAFLGFGVGGLVISTLALLYWFRRAGLSS